MAVTELRPEREAEPDPPASARTKPHLPYFAGLDGLRGVAVAAVLFFHGGFTWMIGGYLGVSTFFTLSGFLITSLLLAERASSGRVSLKDFWTRRFRRLMPAALACLGFVLLFGIFAAEPLQRANLGGDELSCLAYVANWRFIFSGQSYAELFAAPSPVLHFWSLAIEEQFYLLYPLLIAGIVGFAALRPRLMTHRQRRWADNVGRRYRDVVLVVLVVLAALSLAETLFAGFDHNRIYLGTDTRASELLVGGILAAILFHAGVTRRIARKGAPQMTVAVLGVVGLAVAVILWTRLDQTSDWLYSGGFTIYAMISAIIITAAILPTGPVAWVLALAPLRRLGQISYGVYLYHWPVFLWLRQKTSLDIWPRFIVAVAITLVMAEVSYRFLEMPIRKAKLQFGGLKPIRVAPVAVASLAVLAFVIGATAPPPAYDFSETAQGLEQYYQPANATTTTVDPRSLTPPKPTAAMFGDSTALMTNWGLAPWLITTGQGTNVEGQAFLGCSLLERPERRVMGQVGSTDESCTEWKDRWGALVEKGKPTMPIVQTGPWDIADIKIGDDPKWRGPGDPVFDEYLQSEMVDAVDLLSSQGGIVVWLTSPKKGPVPGPEAPPDWNEPARMARFNELVRQLPQLRPGKVVVVDLAQWVESLPPSENARLRPDGVHFTEQTSPEAAEKWIGPAILRAWDDQWVANRKAELEAANFVSVAVFGDATAQAIAGGLEASDTPLHVVSATEPRCGVTRGGFRLDRDQRAAVPEECNQRDDQIGTVLAGQPVDIAVLHTSVWDVTDRQLGDDPTWRALGDPFYDQFLLGELGSAVDKMHASGAKRVVLLLTPHVHWGVQPDGSVPPYKANEPSRVDRLNELIQQTAATRDFVTVIDYAAFARGWGGGEFDTNQRPDGVVPSSQAANEIGAWLAPKLVELAPR